MSSDIMCGETITNAATAPRPVDSPSLRRSRQRRRQVGQNSAATPLGAFGTPGATAEICRDVPTVKMVLLCGEAPNSAQFCPNYRMAQAHFVQPVQLCLVYKRGQKVSLHRFGSLKGSDGGRGASAFRGRRHALANAQQGVSSPRRPQDLGLWHPVANRAGRRSAAAAGLVRIKSSCRPRRVPGRSGSA
jgi:hypothetical protein